LKGSVTLELLSTFSLLQPLTPEHLETLAQSAELLTLNRRQMLYEAGQPGDAVYFLFEGRLQGIDFTLDGREVGLFFVDPKSFCGELPLFDQGNHSESVIAIVQSRVVRIPTERLRTLIFSNSATLQDACTRVAGRVRALTAQRSLLAIPDIPQRICAQLLLLCGEVEADSTGLSIANPPTHQELAIMLNTSRETVTRVLQRLQSSEVCRKEGTHLLEILKPDLLQLIAQGHEKLQ